MNFDVKPLAAGLYLVATPIGNARDITLRALDVLASADRIAAEDTRTARKLMDIHGIPLAGRPLRAYHDHSSARAREALVAAVAAGEAVAYVSEAGTPLLADPGFQLARAVRAAGGDVTAVPGASALLAALSVAGLPTDRFFFAGFLPAAKAARRKALAELGAVPATLVFYESPRRVSGTLGDMCDVWGADRQAALCRELTKRFEEVALGTVAELREIAAARTLRGEIVLVIDRPGDIAWRGGDMEAELTMALETMPLKEAVAAVSGALGLPRRQVYQAALDMRKGRDT